MTIQAPGYQGVLQETSRVLTRGKLEFFQFGFFYDDAKTQPVTPMDTQTYPSYRIITPSGEVLAQGVGITGGSPGYWKIGWVVPKAAELTSVHRRYRMQSTMVDKESRQFEVSFEFDVVESSIEAQEPELQQLITFANNPLRVVFKNTVRPDYLKVVITPRADDANVLHQATLTYPMPVPALATDLQEVQMGTHFAYYTDIPGFSAMGQYSAMWTVRDTPVSQLDFEHQSIEVIGSNTMFLIKSLRMLIDKLQKKLGMVFAYTNEDLIDYLKNGNQLVNAYWPPTGASLENQFKPLEAFVVLAAAWWGLTAQRLLYGETNLDFSGQTVTLSYNPAAELDSVISSFKETLDSQVPNSKKNLVRSASHVGSIATRPYRYRSNQVFPISSGSGQEILSTLTILGILD